LRSCDTELLPHDEYGSDGTFIDGRRISDYMIAVLHIVVLEKRAVKRVCVIAVLQLFFCLCLQFFDAVVWASGRASGL